MAEPNNELINVEDAEDGVQGVIDRTNKRLGEELATWRADALQSQDPF